MEAECIAQEKEIFEMTQSETIEGFRAYLGAIRPPQEPRQTKISYPEKGEEDQEVTMEDLLRLT